MSRVSFAIMVCTLGVVLAGSGSALARPQTEPGLKPGFDHTCGAADAADTPAAPASNTEEAEAQQAQLEELRRQLEILATEVERLRSGEQEVELSDERRRALGLAPSAAATYRRTQGFSFAGYGEALYENVASENESGRELSGTSQFDFLRLVLYSGYRFSDKFIFNSELEVEHGNEIWVEFAYVDYLANDNFTVRGGLLLLPLGLTNEFHEPNVFLGARRPETETRIIPTTWRENGAGVLGSVGRVSYRAYVVNGLDASRFAATGLRGGRQRGSRAKASDLAFAGRLDVTPTAGIFVGGGVYTGGSGQGIRGTDGGELDVHTTIGEVHGQAQLRGFDLRALYARAEIDEAAELSRALRLTGDDGVADTMGGGYVQIGYNVLSRVSERAAVTPYYRFETVNTQQAVAAGFAVDRATDGTFHTFGVEFRPIFNVVVKTDYQWIRNAARTGRNQFNINLGYAF
jgi:hypothetical protein